MPVFIQLAPCDIRCERTCINRRTQLFPIMANCANVVFVGVRDKNTFDLRFARFRPRIVRRDKANARVATISGNDTPKIAKVKWFFTSPPKPLKIAVIPILPTSPKGR